MLDTIMVLFRRCFRREPQTQKLNVEEALRSMYRKGVATGKQQVTTIYGPYCAAHETHLEQAEPYGVYICPLCQVQQQAEAVERAKHWQPDIERHTGPIPASDRPFFAYRRHLHFANQDTEQHRALHWHCPTKHQQK